MGRAGMVTAGGGIAADGIAMNRRFTAQVIETATLPAPGLIGEREPDPNKIALGGVLGMELRKPRPVQDQE